MNRISPKKLSKLGGRVPSSTITGTRKPIRKLNPERKAKRRAGYRKMLAGKEYKAARKEAMERAGNRCEQLIGVTTWADLGSNSVSVARCPGVEALHAHHLRYPKSRPLAARDLKILCRFHHEHAESQKMGKRRMY